jgi:uncharacterized protein YjbI with pentapeptide repeats
MNPPLPDYLNWAFWFKDSASVRDLLVSLVAMIIIPFLVWREFLIHRTAKAALRDTVSDLQFLTHRTAKAALGQLESVAEQVKIGALQAEIDAGRREQQTNTDRDRRITDSFAKAVELLGSDKLEARLGAIYVLERIARESKEDHWPIMETLTAYLLTRLPIQQRAHEVSESGKSETVENRSSTNPANRTVSVRERLEDLPFDIRAVLTVLGRRKVEHDAEGQLINLSKADLSWVDLSGIGLSGVNLTKADLTRANLTRANLARADLTGANLTRADLTRADLTEANLTRASLTKAVLSRANLTRAILNRARLTRADLTTANLTEANLGSADLTEANLTRAILSRNILNGKLCKTAMPDGTVNNRDCPPEPPPPNPSETPPAPN